MQVKILNKAMKDLSKIDKSQALKILKSIEHLSNYPDITNIKKLQNHNPTYRLRVGNYRILFDIENNVIVIGRIKHRKEAY